MITYEAIRVGKFEEWEIKIWVDDALGTIDSWICDNALHNVMREIQSQVKEERDLRKLGHQIIDWNFPVKVLEIINTETGIGILVKRS